MPALQQRSYWHQGGIRKNIEKGKEITDWKQQGRALFFMPEQKCWGQDGKQWRPCNSNYFIWKYTGAGAKQVVFKCEQIQYEKKYYRRDIGNDLRE